MAREGYYIHPDGGRIVAPDEDCPELDKVLGGQADEPDEVNATGDARELAEKEGVDLATVNGTGKNGRITKADVEKHLEG